MKTEKQVEQLAIEKGKEFHSKVDGLDRIKVTQSQSSNWFSDLPEDARCCLYSNYKKWCPHYIL